MASLDIDESKGQSESATGQCIKAIQNLYVDFVANLRLCDQYSQIESDVKSKVGEMIYKDRRGENSHFTVNFAFHRALPEAEVDFAKYFELKILKNMKPLCTHDEFSQQKRSII